jgi:histidyl-tRNA synthetase
MPPPDQRQHAFQAPKGTRDFYPQEMLRRRYIEKAWRDVSIRHGFEEIDGPTFEHTELYTVKSGEGILGEVFGVFSGKDEEQVKAAGSGQAHYALRPEFTPTLARMYAARAAQLPKPTKWFWQQSCYRAERPQRGRLREFGQWNIDLIGDSSPSADAEIVACCVGLLESLGLKPADVRIRFNHRRVLSELLTRLGVSEDHMASAYVLLDRREKLSNDDLEAMAFEFGLTSGDFVGFLKRPRGPAALKELLEWAPAGSSAANLDLTAMLRATEDALGQAGVADWCEVDFNIVRGLAYYTGMVFEIHEVSGKERAIAGGGRYDNLIELFGGPPTPAVGFGMGDVVLGNLLQDKGLMPEGKDLLGKLSAPGASLRPDVFVIANEKEESQAALRPLVASLRRAGLHARHSYKATKNIGKLLKDASDSSSRFAAIIESAGEVTLKNLDAGTQEKIALGDVAATVQRQRG